MRKFIRNFITVLIIFSLGVIIYSTVYAKGDLTEIYSAYYEYLISEINTYGIIPTGAENSYENFFGYYPSDDYPGQKPKLRQGTFAYAELIDFNNDDIPELLVCRIGEYGTNFVISPQPNPHHTQTTQNRTHLRLHHKQVLFSLCPHSG